MEVRERQSGQTAYTSITRVYSPTRGSSAFAYAQTAEVQQEEHYSQPVPRRQEQARQIPKARPVARTYMSTGTRITLVFSMMTLAVATLGVLFRYYTISQQYAVVNELHASIQQTELHIKELNAQLECAVNIQAAQEAAERYGMTYPGADQYVRAGDPLVIDEAPAGAGENEEYLDGEAGNAADELDAAGEPGRTESAEAAPQ